VETALYQGYRIPSNYDSMIIKLIVHDRNRRNAITTMPSALGELVVEGVTTNLDFQYEILNDPDFQSGKINTHFIQEHYGE
jgi:acetyl-CoA carboxylase biotin carboxylase subunit